MHAIDAAVGEEVQYGDQSREVLQLQAARRHIVPGPGGTESQLLPTCRVLLAAFLYKGGKNYIISQLIKSVLCSFPV